MKLVIRPNRHGADATSSCAARRASVRSGLRSSRWPWPSTAWALAVCLSGAAMAQPVYRCADAYSSAPCPNGVPLTHVDARSPAQHAQARAEVRVQQRLGADMERDRLRHEASVRPAMAGSFGPSRPALNAALAERPRKASRRAKASAGTEPFTASVPGPLKPGR